MPPKNVLEEYQMDFILTIDPAKLREFNDALIELAEKFGATVGGEGYSIFDEEGDAHPIDLTSYGESPYQSAPDVPMVDPLDPEVYWKDCEWEDEVDWDDMHNPWEW